MNRPLPMTQTQIFAVNRQKDLKIYLNSVKELVAFLLDDLKIITHQVTIQFVSEKEISKVHEDFFDDPTETDCITFPVDPPGTDSPFHVLGEVFVCPKVAMLYAQDNNIDSYEETSRYVVHGILHLAGYEDETKAAAKKMKAEEDKYVELLKENNLLLKNSPLLYTKK